MTDEETLYYQLPTVHRDSNTFMYSRPNCLVRNYILDETEDRSKYVSNVDGSENDKLGGPRKSPTRAKWTIKYFTARTTFSNGVKCAAIQNLCVIKSYTSIKICIYRFYTLKPTRNCLSNPSRGIIVCLLSRWTELKFPLTVTPLTIYVYCIQLKYL